jgi:hypothetical protein
MVNIRAKQTKAIDFFDLNMNIAGIGFSTGQPVVAGMLPEFILTFPDRL